MMQLRTLVSKIKGGSNQTQVFSNPKKKKNPKNRIRFIKTLTTCHIPFEGGLGKAIVMFLPGSDRKVGVGRFLLGGDGERKCLVSV